MSPAVHVVNPVLAVVVAVEILGVVKADPCSFFSSRFDDPTQD